MVTLVVGVNPFGMTLTSAVSTQLSSSWVLLEGAGLTKIKQQSCVWLSPSDGMNDLAKCDQNFTQEPRDSNGLPKWLE